MDEKRYCDARNGCSRNSQRGEVQEEISCVEGTNAVVDPHTVVIKTVYADIAKTAVFGSGWLLHVARRAQDAFLK